FLGEVPTGGVQWEEGENAATSLAFTVDLAEEASVLGDPPSSALAYRPLGGQFRNMLRPGRVKVTPLRYGMDERGRPIGSGNPSLGSHNVWAADYDGRQLSVQCGGMWSYFTTEGGAEPLWQNRSFSNVDQFEMARQLIAFAQQGAGNIGLLAAAGNSGVLRTETYDGGELARVSTRVEELARRQNG